MGVPLHHANVIRGKAPRPSVSGHLQHHRHQISKNLSARAQWLSGHHLTSEFLVEKVILILLTLTCLRSIFAVVTYVESSDDSDNQEFENGVVVDVGNAIDTTHTNDESEWQEYHPVEFGPDVLPVSGGANPASASSSTMMESTSGGNQPVELTSVLDESDAVISDLVSLSAQRSFSNLNIDNPYCADADFGFDF